MDPKFSGFSPEAFEQFVRAVAVRVLGPSITAFGRGPDGGREATFSGARLRPSGAPCEEVQWHGTGVVQAKCKTSPETAAQDQQWALTQLDQELKKYKKSRNKKAFPDYYIFATNVALSSVSGGGKDKAAAVLMKAGFKDAAIWDSNQLLAFVDAFPEIAKRFHAFFTTGDLLAELAAHFDDSANLEQMATSYLERELRHDHEARLDQGGDRTDERVGLAALFFDLPVSKHIDNDPPIESEDKRGILPPGALAELLTASAYCLDPTTLAETAQSRQNTDDACSMYVYVGGPGSGKSTLGQFLAQIHRAALLLRKSHATLDDEAWKRVRSIQRACVRDELPWPATPRYPFRIDLNIFAKALASENNATTSLADYLIDRFRGNFKLSFETFLKLLISRRWMLILDGLDEVPTSSNRDQVMNAIYDFLAIARQSGSDLLVVATSRPQGYKGEFRSQASIIRYVLPLSIARAMQYAKRYAVAKFGDQGDSRAQDMIARIQESSSRPLTARLMTSPLQVTFLCTLAAARGKPADNRWQLFASYYRTIYERELQKAVPPFSDVLSDHQQLIDRLHCDIGLILQSRGQRTSHTDATVSLEEFSKLAGEYLELDGYGGAELTRLKQVLVDAAESRLVFLTSRTSGSLSFDIRSLQEFMAAECLMSGQANVVVDRINAIVASSYWKNVFLFIAGKAFADQASRHFQDHVVVAVESVGQSDYSTCQLPTSGLVAVSVLESGCVNQHPKYARLLAKAALELIWTSTNRMHYGPDNTVAALVQIFSAHCEQQYKFELERALTQTSVPSQSKMLAFECASQLADFGIDWSIALASEVWNEVLDIYTDSASHIKHQMTSSRWLDEHIRADIKRLNPLTLPFSFVDSIFSRIRRPFISLPFTIVWNGVPLSSVHCDFCNSSSSPTFGDIFAQLNAKESEYGWWNIPLAARKWREDISLAEIPPLLRCAYRSSFEDRAFYSRLVPWPLGRHLTNIVLSEEQVALIESGGYGNSADWLDSEALFNGDSGWQNVSVRDQYEPQKVPFRCLSVSAYQHGGMQAEEMVAMSDLLSTAPNCPTWNELLRCLCLGGSNLVKIVGIARLRSLLERFTDRSYPIQLGIFKLELVELALLSWLGHSDLNFRFHRLMDMSEGMMSVDLFFSSLLSRLGDPADGGAYMRVLMKCGADFRLPAGTYLVDRIHVADRCLPAWLAFSLVSGQVEGTVIAKEIWSFLADLPQFENEVVDSIGFLGRYTHLPEVLTCLWSLANYCALGYDKLLASIRDALYSHIATAMVPFHDTEVRDRLQLPSVLRL